MDDVKHQDVISILFFYCKKCFSNLLQYFNLKMWNGGEDLRDFRFLGEKKEN